MSDFCSLRSTSSLGLDDLISSLDLFLASISISTVGSLRSISALGSSTSTSMPGLVTLTWASILALGVFWPLPNFGIEKLIFVDFLASIDATDGTSTSTEALTAGASISTLTSSFFFMPKLGNLNPDLTDADGAWSSTLGRSTSTPALLLDVVLPDLLCPNFGNFRLNPDLAPLTSTSTPTSGPLSWTPPTPPASLERLISGASMSKDKSSTPEDITVPSGTSIVTSAEAFGTETSTPISTSGASSPTGSGDRFTWINFIHVNTTQVTLTFDSIRIINTTVQLNRTGIQFIPTYTNQLKLFELNWGYLIENLAIILLWL